MSDAPHPARSARQPLPLAAPAARFWRLDPAVVYLNHGSFGACPTPVLEAQQRYRDRMEADGVRWFVDDAWHAVDRARRAVAAMIHADAADLVFVPNVTWGVATILDNLLAAGLLGTGDELLVTDAEYSACRAIVDRAADRAGARVVVAPVPFPAPDPTDAAGYASVITASIVDRITARTRLALVSFITSATATRYPAAAIVRELHARNIMVILDAAHGVGCVPIDLAALRPEFWVSNCHKWLCSPKGSAVMAVRADVRERLGQTRARGFRPLALSVHRGGPAPSHACYPDGSPRSVYHLEFDYVGTSDITAYAAVADAIDVVPGLGGYRDWLTLMAANRAMAVEAGRLLAGELGEMPAVPAEMCGPMVLVRLSERVASRVVGGPAAIAAGYEKDPAHVAAVARFGVQVPVYRCPDGQRYIRVSSQVYNTPEQVAYLAGCVRGG